MSEFDDWYDSAEFEGQALFQLVDRELAEFILTEGRKLQRERDALREALQCIADECDIEFQWAASVANAALATTEGDK